MAHRPLEAAVLVFAALVFAALGCAVISALRARVKLMDAAYRPGVTPLVFTGAEKCHGRMRTTRPLPAEPVSARCPVRTVPALVRRARCASASAGSMILFSILGTSLGQRRACGHG